MATNSTLSGRNASSNKFTQGARSRRADGKELCAYTHRVCLQNKLDGFDYCIRHILVDKSAPFKQCSFIHPQSGKRCPNAARRTERRDSTLCPWHIKKLYLKRKQQQQQQHLQVGEDSNVANSMSSLLRELEHYCPANHEKKRLKVDWIKQEDESTTASESLRQKIAEAAANANESDSEDDSNNPLVDDVFRSDVVDSDSESIDSDQDDPLKHAGVYTAEEVSLLLRDKMLRLQSLYINQFKHLQYLLREKRKKFLHSVKVEKDIPGIEPIHNMKRSNTRAENDYSKLKALLRYHRYHGKEALLKKQVKEKRKATNKNGDAPSHKPMSPTCIYANNSESCKNKPLPLTHYCKEHILYDVHQVLFRPCAAGEPACLNPIISFQRKNTCILHKDVRTDSEDVKKLIGADESNLASHVEPELFQTMDDIASLGLDAVVPGSLFGLDQFGDLGDPEPAQSERA